MVNKESNDDHISTVQLWQQNGAYPDARDCWECFQPPLFYSIVKPICTLTKSTTKEDIFIVIQAVNLVLSLAVLGLIMWFINTLKLNKLLTVALVVFWGLNPELVSIGALATNDLLAILLGILFTIQTLRYFVHETVSNEIILCVLLLLLGITKGNGLIFLGILPILVFVKMVWTKTLSPIKLARKIILWLFTVVTIAGLGNYVEKYEQFNNPFITNVDPPYEKATWDTPGEMEFRKGVNTLKQAYFAFPLASLLEQPYNENGYQTYPEHRTNLWTQFLGQFSNHLFERHPGSWLSYNNDMYNFSRVNFITHILLFLAIVIGIFMTFIKNKSLTFSTVAHLIIVLISLAFIIKYSAQYRDFSFMKVVFMFPAYLSLIHLSIIGIGPWKLDKLFAYLLIVCTLLYQINFIYLVQALMV